MGRNSVSRFFVSGGAAIGELPGVQKSKADRLAELLKVYPWNEAIRRLKSNAPGGAIENEVEYE